MFLGAATGESLCDGTEDIQTLQSPYTDTSQLRITNMVYKAVYAIAHAMHNAVCQKTNSTRECDKLTRIESKQVCPKEIRHIITKMKMYFTLFTSCLLPFHHHRFLLS